jgi:GTPase SAR1 family protein
MRVRSLMPKNHLSVDSRILLLGAAGAGKTALLGALARAAESQQDILGGPLTDLNGGLAELQKQTYGNPVTTGNELTAYPVSFDGPATLIDCDGRLAQAYLSGQRALEDGTPLARSIKTADAIVLTVAPAEIKQLEYKFQQIEQFLKEFEQDRGRRSDSAGLPVYLVLTKCDLLGRADDTSGAWIQRLEESKRQLGRRFHEFLDQTKFSPFGQIDLHMWATAIKRPQFTDHSDRSREPYGVAELFRQVLASAQAFQLSRMRGQRRLRRAVIGLSALLAVMGLVAAAFWLSRPSAEVAALENEIDAIVTAPAADRLREPLANRFKELGAIQANPAFAQLPSPLKEEVHQAAQELAAYQELAKKFDNLKRVRFFRKDEDIATHRRSLDNIVVPDQYAAEWAATRLTKKLTQYRGELDAVSTALAIEKDWLTDQNAIGDKLLRMAIPGAGTPERQGWINSADIFLRGKDLTKPVPHVTNMKLKDLYEFPSLRALRAAYEGIKARVAKIRGGLTNS